MRKKETAKKEGDMLSVESITRLIFSVTVGFTCVVLIVGGVVGLLTNPERGSQNWVATIQAVTTSLLLATLAAKPHLGSPKKR